MSDSVYLNKLGDSSLFLASPIPLEVSGSTGNYVATWVEGNVDGEGTTRDLAVDDCRLGLAEAFKALRTKVSGNAALNEDDQRKWDGLLHFIGENRGGRSYKPAPGEDYMTHSADEDEYKGPIYG